MADSPSLVGQTIAHYRVVAKLGSGGMGVVYRAHDEKLDRDVAVKVLPAGLLSDEAARKRFRNEALALAKLNHPSIATVHDFGSEGGVDFLVMELVQGVPLRSKLGSPLGEKETRRFGVQLAEGLAAAHAEGVIHRDLKPDNLHITPDGRLKILDFGLAKLFRPEAVVDQTQSIEDIHSATGTLPYMSPEQLRGDPADLRSDIYGAGAVLYEMATARKPFPETQPARLIDAILHNSPQPVSGHGVTASPSLGSIILKALEKEPARRYQSARELLVALEATDVAAQPAAPSKRSSVAVIALMLILIAGAAIGLNLGKIHDRLTSALSPAKTALQPATPVIPMRRSIAVLGFKNTSARAETAWLSTGLSEMLTTELGTGERLRTVAEENVARAKMDLALSDADSLAKDTLTRVRNHLGTDYVVLGSFVDLGKEAGGQVRVDMRLQDARTGETIGVVSETGTESELFDLVSRAGSDLRSKLGIENISEAEAGSVRAAISTNQEAARLYAQGLEKLRVFDALAARDILEKAVAADPNYALAHSALSTAWTSLGYDAKAADEAKKASDLSGSLPRLDRLTIQGRYYEAIRNWPKAVEAYRSLSTFAPDNLDYGLRLAQVQTSGSLAKDALATVETLRKLPAPASDDPRIDLAEEAAARGLSDFKRELAAAQRATEKGKQVGARLLVARAELAQARAFYSLGDIQQFQTAAEEARRMYADAGDRSGEATALHNLATGLYDHGDRAAAQKLQEESLATCRKIGNQRCMADGFNSIGIALKDEANFAGARQAYEQAIAIDQETGDRMGEAVGVNNIAVLLYEQGKLGAARKQYERSLAITREIGEKRGIARALTNLAIVLQEQGQLAESRKLQEQSLTIRREIADKAGVGIALNNLAVVLLDQGDLVAAQKAVDEQMPIFQQGGLQRGLAYGLFLQGELQKERGNLDQARQTQEQVLAMRKKMGEKTTVEDSLLALADLSIEEGHPGEAEQPARQVVEQARKERERANELAARTTLARSLLAQGKPVEAGKEIRIAEEAAATTEDRLSAIAVTTAVARIHAANGRAAEASNSLRKVVAEAVKLGCGRCELEARLALGEIEMQESKNVGARSRLVALEKEANAKGFILIARQANAAKSK